MLRCLRIPWLMMLLHYTVQTADQYLYVYKAVLDLVKNILQGLDPLTAGAPGAQKYDVG